MNNINKKPDFTFVYHAKVLRNAILTDFIQFSPFLFGCPFIINNKVKNVLERHNIQDYYLFPAKIYDKDKVISEDYYLFYCPILDYDIIDFEKFVFYTQLGIDKKKRKWHFINNLKEFEKFKGIGNLKVGKLVLNKKFDTSLNFFTGRIGGIFVSEALKKDIEESGLSGVHALSTYEPEVVIE